MVTTENKTTQTTSAVNKNAPGKIPFFQPKLSINEPGDEYEQEADHMADQVMRMPANDQPFFSPNPLSISRIQRKCHECEEEEKLQRKPVNDIIQRDNKVTGEEKAAEDQETNPFQLRTRFTPKLNNTTFLDFMPVLEELNFRGLPFPSAYFDESSTEFSRQYQFYKRFGLGKLAQKAGNIPVLKLLIPDVSGDPDAALANLTTSLAVGSALRRDFPLETERDSTNMHVFNLKTWHFDLGGGGGPNVRRKCAHCQDDEKLQRKETYNQTMLADASTENYISSLNGKGHSLTQEEKNFFEPRFGYDFSGVQLHTNKEANQSAQSINALAFTQGNNIVFGENQYQPNTNSGKKLMAHELTHILQQNRSGSTPRVCRNVSDASRCSRGVDPLAPPSPDIFIILADMMASTLLSQAQFTIALDLMTVGNPPTGKSFTAFQHRFGTPHSINGKFRNRFNGTLHDTLTAAEIAEMRSLGEILKRIATVLDRDLNYQCLGHSPRTFGTCTFRCATKDDLKTCDTAGNVIGICPDFWSLGPQQQGIGIIHEAFHILFHFGDHDNGPLYAHTDTQRFTEPECFASFVADINGAIPFDPSCPAIP